MLSFMPLVHELRGSQEWIGDVDRRTPKRSISAAANGAVRPNSVMFTDIASPTTPCDHPNSWCSGFIITPGTERKPAAPRIATKLTAATTHAQWILGTVLRAAVDVTASLSPSENTSTSGMNDSIRQKHAKLEECTASPSSCCHPWWVSTPPSRR